MSGKQTHTCFACGLCIEDGEPVSVENHRTGNVWMAHSAPECLNQPTPDSYAATARFMASFGDDDGVDWDRWKDEKLSSEE